MLPSLFRLTGLILVFAPLAMAEEPKKEVPLVNKAKDIHVLSDRDEPILDHFRRNRILVGAVVPEELTKILMAKTALPKFFVTYASQNDDATKVSTFGAYLEIAPPTAAALKLLEEHKKQKLALTLVLRRDDKKAGLYHVVGCTPRTPVGFFDNDKKNDVDGFSQKDLCFKGEMK